MSSLISSIIGGAGSSPFLLFFAIVIGVFFLEDTTVVVVGLLAADKVFSVPFALFALYTGIICGDLILYCVGRLASTHPRLAHFVDHDLVAPFRTWLETRFVLTVFTARFIPGARMPTYTASGFFRSPLSKFVLTSLGAISIWTTLLFSISFWFGNATAGWLGPARWGIALIFLLILFFVGRHNLLAYRARKSELSVTNG
ncbi:MAG: VTT domain-containing protein [Candidatus Pacebacteria bacterium]|nr:VTT domain-containing protein [Candidatus Paceibacterota bacterium]